MPLFEYDIQKHRNKTESRNGERAFFEWCDANGLGKEGFSMVVSSDKTHKGKPVTFFVESYGYYQVEGGWMVYISYRGDCVNHVRQHTWRYAERAARLNTYRLNEFINI